MKLIMGVSLYPEQGKQFFVQCLMPVGAIGPLCWVDYEHFVTYCASVLEGVLFGQLAAGPIWQTDKGGS